MPDEDDLRAGLKALAERAPTSGDAAAVRNIGQRRRRTRRAAVAGAAVLALAAGGVVGAAVLQRSDGAVTIEAAGPESDDAVDATDGSAATGATTSTSTSRTVTTPTTSLQTVPGDPTAPTQAAIDADEAFRQPPPGYQDCGSPWMTSGYPTTTAPRPDLTDCIAAAFEDGAASQYSYSARNFNGGTTEAIFRVEADGTARRIVFTVDQAGELISRTNPCTELQTSSGGAPWEPDCIR